MSRQSLIFEKQWLHAFLLAGLLAGSTVLGGLGPLRRGQLCGIATPTWYWLAIGVAVAHQVYTWACWRTQLHGSLLTRVFGARAFGLYAAGFSVLGITRVVLVFTLAVSNRESFQASPLALKLLALIALIPAIYLFYSVKRYFSFRRAFGIDHFDDSFRTVPFVRGGIFRYTSNGMYAFGFLLLWVPSLWFASLAALTVALFNHLYIWVHYLATEKPDMKRIYGQPAAG
jgi:hypothetical protein